ncbi:MAG: zinc-ribbon domain-containing protein [Desulfuromonadaceae bacterium]
MKISCPKCNAGGTLPEHEIPDSGRFITCPRCKEGFTVTKPCSESNVYRVDTCPSCGYSSFGDQMFSACPGCGVVIKMFVERQREELLVKHNQELLEKKHNSSEFSPPPPEAATKTVADLIENLHPVNLISWGVAAVAIVVFCTGLWGALGFDITKIQESLMLESDEQPSRFSVFLHYGLIHWVKILYGITAMTVAVLFMKRLKLGLKALCYLLWTTIVLVPTLYTITFIYWIIGPISHSISGYFINSMEIIFISALVGVPLYLLEQYLHKRTITSVVKL